MADKPPFAIARADCLSEAPHGFFGNAHGAAQFGYGGPGEESAIAAIRAAAADTIVAGGVLAAPHQVHSADVEIVDSVWDDVASGRPVADALVTAQPGVVLGIVTADCAPVLFADRAGGIVGAAHAGWRGAHGGVIENTIKAMETLGAQRARIAAAIGPTIAQASYEVDTGFRDQFEANDLVHFKPAPEREGKARWLFDLPAYCLSRLNAAGVRHAQNLALDTYTHPHRFYSYRRATHYGAPNYGRQISMIAVP